MSDSTHFDFSSIEASTSKSGVEDSAREFRKDLALLLRDITRHSIDGEPICDVCRSNALVFILFMLGREAVMPLLLDGHDFFVLERALITLDAYEKKLGI